MTTYRITNPRAIFPRGKVAENNPDRFVTIYGTFYAEDGSKMSFTSKAISKDMAKDVEFSLDIDNGILTIPTKERGRRALDSDSQADIDAMLNALREEK